MTLRHLLTPAAASRILLGWVAVIALPLSGRLLPDPLPTALLATVLGLVVAVILVCAFGVVHEAEHLAHRLGDPYGSLVLTLSIVLIEVVLIAAVMLGPGEHATIARDSVMAVAMIIMTLVVGLGLLLGGLRNGSLAPNRAGTSAYLVMITVLGGSALAVPRWIGEGGAFTLPQSALVVVVTIGLYAFFLGRQMGAQSGDFREVAGPLVGPSAGTADGGFAGTTAGHPAHRPGIAAVIREHRREILGRLALLVMTVLPIVLLSHDMAGLLDEGLSRVGAPAALSGVVIAMIVFLPESITAIRAALSGEIQRVVNLCHGALVSTVGLTIPVVLVIGALTGQTVVLGESGINLLLLATALLIGAMTFSAPRVTAIHGAAHLAVFAVYVMTLLGS